MSSRQPSTDLDFELLDELRDIMGDDFVTLVQSWQRDAAMRVKAMGEALARADGETLRQLAHSLKGSSANLGAVHVAAACQDLERLGGERDMTGARARFDDLTSEVDAATAALGRYLTG